MKNKEKILELIKIKNCPISAKNILIAIWKDVDKTTIYRNLEKLLQSGVILEDFSNTWEKLYSIKKEHHHHFICDKCNSIENIWCFIKNNILNMEEEFWFKVNNHSFILNWICKKCIESN